MTRRSEEVVLQWTNGVNMTLELTELPGTRCSYRGGAMPWDAASSVTVAGCPEAESEHSVVVVVAPHQLGALLAVAHVAVRQHEHLTRPVLQLSTNIREVSRRSLLLTL